MAPLRFAAKFDPFLSLLGLCPHPLHPGAIHGKEGIEFCHLATLSSTEETSAGSNPPQDTTEDRLQVTNEDREVAVQTDQSEHVKGLHGKEDGEEVTKTQLQSPAEERESSLGDTEKTCNTTSDEELWEMMREKATMDKESEELVSQVADSSNPPEQRPHMDVKDAKGLPGKEDEKVVKKKPPKMVILKSLTASEMAKLRLKPLPYQEIQRIFQNKVAGVGKVHSKMWRKCKGCDFDRESLIRHLGHKKACKDLYNQQELDAVKREAKTLKKVQRHHRKLEASKSGNVKNNADDTNNATGSCTPNTDANPKVYSMSSKASLITTELERGRKCFQKLKTMLNAEKTKPDLNSKLSTVPTGENQSENGEKRATNQNKVPETANDFESMNTNEVTSTPADMIGDDDQWNKGIAHSIDAENIIVTPLIDFKMEDEDIKDFNIGTVESNLHLRATYDAHMMSTVGGGRGRGGYPKIRCRKGGCVNLVL